MKISFKLSFVCLFVLASIQFSNAQTGYKVSKVFHIASNGGWDYPAVDMSTNKLYISHATQVNILDRNTGDSLGFIPNTSGVHGIAFVPSLNKGYTSNGKTNDVTVFNLTTGKEIGKVATGKNPDWIMYDAFSKKLITSNHSGGDITVIDPKADTVVATIFISGIKLETIVSDQAGKLFINVEDKHQIAEVDIINYKLLNLWSLEPSEEPTGLAIDVKTKRLFSTCNKMLVVMDATNGKIIDTLPIGSGTDGVVFDPSSKLIFTANGEGTITVVKELSKDSFKVIETIPTKRGARTIAIDEKTHTLYLPTADYDPTVNPNAKPRPSMIPGSFQVLVVSK
jgi:DNA-binding beta-propeller fold protein YncE